MNKYIVILLACLSPISVTAQAINNQYSYRSMGLGGYTRLQYENDYFTATDEFYTQGIHYEYSASAFKNIPLKFLTVHTRDDNMQYGLALQHNAYTPASIQDTKIRYGDRPYAASFMLQYFSIATNTARKQRISSTLSLGVTGHIAGGEWMQNTIHKATNNVMPQGWKYQVANDVVINYKLLYEKGIVQAGNYFLLNATASADAGTLLTKATVGANIMIGFFDSPYGGGQHHKFNIYLYTHPEVNAVGYDATLQGGVFNGNNSPYRVPSSDIERIVFNNRYGIMIRYGRVYIEYFRYNISKEFSTGEVHAWGGIQAGLAFR